MSDFVAILTRAEQAPMVASALRNRPHLQDRPVTIEPLQFGGALVFMTPPGRGYDAYRGPAGLIAAAGRPRVCGVDHAALGGDGFGRAFAGLLSDEGAATLALAGMGACLVAEPHRLRIFTDRLGSRPVYAGYESSGRLVAIGTLLEPVALVAGRERDVDRVSLAELLVYNAITFPYTSRQGVSELAPASCTTVVPARSSLTVSTYWEPREPQRWPSADELSDELTQAIRTAGTDTTLGCNRVAVALSGGRDSRAVLGAVPSDRLACGLTYVCRMNRETEIAGRIARSFGVQHMLCRRSEDFYEHLLERGTALLGTELRGHAHGLCVPDARLDGAFDLLLGGQLSDTLLKDHFMPREERDRWRTKSIRERLLAPVRPWRARRRALSQSTLDRVSVEERLQPDIRAAVRHRRAERLHVVSQLRPLTAAEWSRFWPLSRQDDSAHTLGNSRLMPCETLFNHPAIIEVAARIPPQLRAGGALANRVFQNFYGPSIAVENANTGLSVLATRREEARAKRARRGGVEPAAIPDPEDPRPWNASAGSWIDPVLLQKLSPVWKRHRQQLSRSDASGILDGLLDRDGAELVARYHDDLPATTCHMAVQLAWRFYLLAGR